MFAMSGSFRGVVVWLSVVLISVNSQPTFDRHGCADCEASERHLERLESDYLQLQLVYREERERVKTLEDTIVKLNSSDHRAPCKTSRNQTSVNVTLIKELFAPSQDSCRGVAIAGKEIFILGKESRMVRVYQDEEDFPQFREFSIDQVTLPHDMVYIRKGGFLLISDHTNKCIWKLVTDGEAINLTRWLNSIPAPCTMSLTRDGNVLLAQDMGGSEPNKLVIYDSNAEVVLSLNLPAERGPPQHAIQTPWDTFIVSHSKKISEKQRHFLYQISNEGEVLNQWSSKINLDDLDWVPFLTLDATQELLLAAEVWKHRILVFDARTLNFTQIITSSGESVSNRPFRLLLDQSTRRLFSCHWATREIAGVWRLGRVDVYQQN